MKKPSKGWELHEWSKFTMKADYQFMNWLILKRNFSLSREDWLKEKAGLIYHHTIPQGAHGVWVGRQSEETARE